MSSGLGCDVRRAFSIVACLLAVLWLPATLHCGLEAAGFLDQHAHEETTASDSDCGDTCANDSCAAVEDGAYKRSSELISLPAPVLTACQTCAAPPPQKSNPPTSISPETTDSPPELARTWQFTARMAFQPGAPSIS
jgi:hypothetical protein